MSKRKSNPELNRSPKITYYSSPIGTSTSTPTSNASNVSNENASQVNCNERRKQRKDHLDSVRSKRRSPLFDCQNTLPSTNLGSSSSAFLNSGIPLTDITNVSPSNPINHSMQPALVYPCYLNYTPNVQVTNRSTLIVHHSVSNIATTKRRLQSNPRTISPIPMVNFTDVDDNLTNPPRRNHFIGISKDYLDHADQNVICEMCHAKLWKFEAHRSQKKDDKTCYSLCCGYGKVLLPPTIDPGVEYTNLFRGVDGNNKLFLKNIRRYNSIFSFTSMGGKIDNSINRGNSPFIYRLSGQNYHSIGSLLPEAGSKPKFCQLYIYDTENEVCNRQQSCGDTKKSSNSSVENEDRRMIEELKKFLDSMNQLVKVYRMVHDCYKENPHVDLKLRLIGKRDQDGRTYNLPTASEVAALIVGDISVCLENRDIVVQSTNGRLQRISELHPKYLPLQYPLLFPFGEDGYRPDILHRNLRNNEMKTKKKRLSMREFFAYKIQDRLSLFSLILNSRRLFQQFLVDGYTMIEAERLNYIRYEQQRLCCDSYVNLSKLKNDLNVNLSRIGQLVILPSSFTGGARYMMQNYLDAMSLCKWFGYPDYFITLTCNPNWPEIKRFLKDTTLSPEDRPDILCRLFKVKLDSLITDLKDNSLLSKVSAVVYTIEFQKRGLPHAHICLFMDVGSKLHTVDLIDKFISAEIPDKNEDFELYNLVSEFMIHGPCGNANPNCPCMIDKRCSKNFPKKFLSNTTTDSEGFPIYRRRDTGFYIEKSGVKLDNRGVVPYNKTLLKRYQAHINVEWCNQAASIKYLFKYINKDPDRATIAVVPSNNNDMLEQPIDEIQDYYDCRYISACEASWRIFSFNVHYRNPSFVRLPFHLPGQQHVLYEDDDDIEDVLNKSSIATSMFLGWLKCNQQNEIASTLSYVEFPSKFVWKQDIREWHPRKQGLSIGRIHSVSPALGEAYFLCILLNKVKGPKSFEDIRTVNGQVFQSFRDACFARGLLDDDNEYIEAIKEASNYGSGYYLRALFSIMLLSNSLSRPEFVWQKSWEYLSDGILHKQRKLLKFPELYLNEHQLQNLTLYEVESYLLQNNSTLKDFPSMPFPDIQSCILSKNRLILDEQSYNSLNEQNEYESLSTSLTNEQRIIFDEITSAVNEKKGGVFFVYGYGGTGKTFLWKTLSTSIRSKGEIVLNVASSGIASLLLSGGRTAHSRFHIPINLTEDSTCYIKHDSESAELLKQTQLIIWDEAPMMHKHAFEALDRTLNDIFSSTNSTNNSMAFGGKVVVFGGDFRQILPVVQGGGRQDIVNASLCSSYLWNKCKLRNLTKNMRLNAGIDSDDIKRTENFAKWLLDIGEGKFGGTNDGEATVDIPDDLLIKDSSDPISALIEFVYPSVLQNFNVTGYFSERAILAPKNEVVHEINDRLLDIFPGEVKEYLSSDSICQSEFLNDRLESSVYSPDVLNGLQISGLPNHRLLLKVGVPIMFLRNIDQQAGLCNGTRLRVIQLGQRVIEAEVISGTNTGTRTFIPRINIIPSDKKIPFKFQRRQFPISVCFAMTINKSQGQTLSKVGLYLKEPMFSHGQLYVALSRVKSKDGIKLLILDGKGEVTNQTTNVVYKEIFANL